jgi:transposase-like protein
MLFDGGDFMKCPKCESDNFEVISKTTGKMHGGTGIFGLIRFCLIICTCGLWLLVPQNRGKVKSKTIFVCRNCGNEFDKKHAIQ